MRDTVTSDARHGGVFTAGDGRGTEAAYSGHEPMRAAPTILLCVASCGGRAPPAVHPTWPGSAPPPLTLHVVAESDTHYEVFGAGSATLVDLGWDLVLGHRDRFDASHKLGEALRVQHRMQLFHVAGSWPDVWGATAFGPGMGPAGEIVRWRGDRWDRVALLKPFDKVDAIAPFHGGVIALVDVHGEKGRSLRAFGHDPQGKVPLLEPATIALCETRLLPGFVRTNARNEVFVSGAVCAEGGELGDAAVERWSAAGQHTFDILPHAPSWTAGLTSFHVTSTSAFAGGFEVDRDKHQRAYFARFDGKTWSTEPIPLSEEVRSLVPLPDGSVLALGASSGGVALAQRTAAGAWARLTVTGPPVVPFRMWATSLADIWIIARQDDRSSLRELLLHSTALGPPLRRPAS